MTWLEIAVVLGAAVFSAALFYLFVARQSTPPHTLPEHELTEGAAFLFRQDQLHHANDAARNLLGDADWRRLDWTQLRSALINRYPDMPASTKGLGAHTVSFAAAQDHDQSILQIRKSGSAVHVNVVGGAATPSIDPDRISAMEEELKTLRMASGTAPNPIWTLNRDGNVIWHNGAYALLYRHIHQQDPDPQRPLFETFAMKRHINGQTRASIQRGTSGETLWFNVASEDTDNHTVFHATDINAVIQAEVAQRNFVQTLAKTFAQLSTGLSIFDRNGQLALFNPALVDLTALPAEFLSARPDLLSFFDRLRDNRVMPEPKNYHSWRQEIADVIAAATDGRYQETWTLDSGRTYRVSGRPHPDGAIAFLIEDISAEISMTRNYRAELEMSQSLMDSLDDGLAVFSAAGVLQFCNVAYREMWGLDPESSFADVTIIDSIRDWQRQSDPNPTWGDIRDFVFKVGERAPWDSVIERSDANDRLLCMVAPLVSGATLVRFERFEHTVSMQTGTLSLIND